MEKRGVILLVSLLFVVSMGAVVIAENEPFVLSNAENASLLNVTNATGSYLTRMGGGFFLRNNTGTQLPGTNNNQTYTFNISINNSGAANDDFMGNITNITIEMPTGLLFAGVTYGLQNITSGDGDILLERQINVVLNTTSYVTWNGTQLMNSTTISDASSVAIVQFNATIDPATFSDGALDFIVRISNNSAGDLNAPTFNFTITTNITIDTAAPTITAASTNNTLNQINVTFSENLDDSSVVVGMFNGTGFQVPSGASRRIVTAESRIGGFTTDSNSYAFTLNQSYLPNGTPTLHLNESGVTDRAGNALVISNITAGVSYTNVTAGDQAAPAMNTSGLTYDHSTRTIQLGFNETVDAGTLSSAQINITGRSGAPSKTVVMNSTDFTVAVNDNATLVLSFNQATADFVSGFRSLSLNITLNNSAIQDNSGNLLSDGGLAPTSSLNRSFNIYNNDSIANNLSTTTYNESTGILILTFNETMDPNLIDLSTVFISNVTAPVAGSETSLGGATIDKSNNGTIVKITLTQLERANVSYMFNGDSTPSIYLIYNNSATNSFKDIGGTPGIDIPSNITEIQSVTIQTTGSNLIRYPHLNTTFGNVLGQETEHTKAGAVNFSLHFDDAVSTDPEDFGTINITHAGGTVDTATCLSLNRTLINCTVTITSGDDGQATIQLSGLLMANGITSVDTNISNILFIDTVDPFVTRISYHDTDYNDANRTGDSVLIEFNENVTSATASATRATTTERLVISTAANDIFNLSVTSDVFNGSGTYEGGGVETNRLSSYAAGANFRGYLNLSYVNITLNDTFNFSQRGLHSINAEKPGNSSGLSLGVGQDIISDYAGNLAVTNGRHDIADGIVVFEANILKYFSVPFCVDQGDISNQTGTVTGSIKSFGQSGYTTITSGQLNPLLGYEANITSEFNLFVHAKAASECGLVAHSTSINQNFTLLGVDNNNQTNATKLFGSLGDGSQVNNLYPVPNTLSTIETTVAEYNARTFLPFQAYWVFPDFDASSKNFNGLGVN
tara:strand:+ start:318 stop:3377 length:3060 start_codon:yes stop_codon:yes gene_type:complete